MCVSSFRRAGRRHLPHAALLLLMALSCMPAVAQSQWEVYGGFAYLRAQTSPELSPFGLDHVNSYGWQAAATEYPIGWPEWLGGTVEVSGVYAQPTITIPAGFFGPGNPPTNESVSNVVKTSGYTLMAGPSFAYRKRSAFEPFAHVLFGGVYGSAKLTSKGASLVGTNATVSDWSFGFGAGGGVDVKITPLVAVRGQADYIRTAFQNGGSDREDNLRATIGLVFRF